MEKFIVLNHNFKEAKMRKIDLIRKELKRLESLKKKAAKHMRSKNTKEQMFSCDLCSIMFQTMNAKLAHEKRHSQKHDWAQCRDERCLRFYKVARGYCRFCAKH